MNPYQIIEKYYDKHSKLYEILIIHSEQVRDKALAVVDKHPELLADRVFIAQAAMIHDVGIFLTRAPIIDCYGSMQYICHGYLGADIIRNEGYHSHALVCERHTGTGLSLSEIKDKHLPLPHREMQPITIEEQIICYADKFFSKTNLYREITVDKIAAKLRKYSEKHTLKFYEWHNRFE